MPPPARMPTTPSGRTGVPEVVEHMFSQVRNNGKLLFFGVNPTEARVRVSPFDVYRKDLTIYGSFALRFTFGDALALLEGGTIDVVEIRGGRAQRVSE